MFKKKILKRTKSLAIATLMGLSLGVVLPITVALNNPQTVYAQDPAPVACQCAQHTAEQGAFPHAVGAQKGEKFPPIHIEAHILQHRMVGIGKG